MNDNSSQPPIRSAFQVIEVENIDKPDKTARQHAAEIEYTPEYERPPSRRPASEREDPFSVAGWLFEGAAGLIDEVRHHDLWMPEEFWVHVYAARREGKWAFQIALDEVRSQLNARRQQEIERAEREERRGDITIEF